VSSRHLAPDSLGGPTSQTDPNFAADYEALRSSVGALHSGRDVLRVVGPDALEYLQGQCSQDVAALVPGTSADALLLSPQGKLDALVRVARLGDEELLVDVDAGYGEAVTKRLARFKLRVKAVIEPSGWRCVSLRGPSALAFETVEAATLGAAVVLRYEWNGVVGVDLLGEAPEVPTGTRRCGAEAWHSVRVEAGIPQMGSELDERTIAAEAGLLERCVSLTKGCYTGQELVARLDARGNKVSRRLRGLVMIPLPNGSGHASFSVGSEMFPAVQTGQTVQDVQAGDAEAPERLVQIERSKPGDKVVGSITSAAWSPELETFVGLGYVHRDVAPSARVWVRRDQTGTQATTDESGDVEDTFVSAEVRELPLVV